MNNNSEHALTAFVDRVVLTSGLNMVYKQRPVKCAVELYFNDIAHVYMTPATNSIAPPTLFMLFVDLCQAFFDPSYCMFESIRYFEHVIYSLYSKKFLYLHANTAQFF